MSLILLIFLIISLAGVLFMVIYFFIKNRNTIQFVICLIILAAAIVVLYFLFFSGFAPIPKGDTGNDIYFLIILYICMFLGMLAEQGYAHFTKPVEERRPEKTGKTKKKHDWAPFMLPLVTSPIIFIPLFAALQNVDVDIMKLTAPRLMVFFVAFENGFFWKGYLEKQREEFRKGEGMSKGIVKKTDTNDKGKS